MYAIKIAEQLEVSVFSIQATLTDFPGNDEGRSELCSKVQILKPNNQNFGTVKCIIIILFFLL